MEIGVIKGSKSAIVRRIVTGIHLQPHLPTVLRVMPTRGGVMTTKP